MNADIDKKDLIVACVVDGINRFMNQVLIPGGFINEEKLKIEGSGLGSNLNKSKYEIANSIADKLSK